MVFSLSVSSRGCFLGGLGHCCPVFPNQGPFLAG